MKLSECYFSGTAFGLVFVIELDASGYTSTIIKNTDGVIRMNGHHNVIAVSRQRFVDVLSQVAAHGKAVA